MKILDEIHNILYYLYQLLYNARHVESEIFWHFFFSACAKQRLSVGYLYQIFSGGNRGQGHGKDAEHDFEFVDNY